MKIKDLKTNHPIIYARALECQKEQGNEPNDEVDLFSDAKRGGFIWCLTKEGSAAWGDIEEFGYYGTFYKTIPKENRPEYWDKKGIV